MVYVFAHTPFTPPLLTPQGKRIVGEDGSVAVNDMYHENQMLSSEIANMRTRLKALQETVEVLTAKNTALLAEKATSGWITCGCGCVVVCGVSISQTHLNKINIKNKTK